MEFFDAGLAAILLLALVLLALVYAECVAPRRRSAKNPPCSECEHCLESWSNRCSLVRDLSTGDSELCLIARNDRRCRFKAKERAEGFHEWLSEMEGAEE